MGDREHYSLKLPTEEDFPDLLRMAREFALASPYKDYEIDDAKIAETVQQLLTSPSSILIVLTFAGGNVGVLAGTVTEFLFNRDKIASEIVWWVDPAHRNAKSLDLLKAYEYWAKHKMGCRLITLSSLDDKRLERLYRLRGYRKTEEAFIKEI